MLRTVMIIAGVTLILLALFGLGAAFLGFPGVAGATAGIAQLAMYAFLIIGVGTVLVALFARWVRD